MIIVSQDSLDRVILFFPSSILWSKPFFFFPFFIHYYPVYLCFLFLFRYFLCRGVNGGSTDSKTKRIASLQDGVVSAS